MILLRQFHRLIHIVYYSCCINGLIDKDCDTICAEKKFEYIKYQQLLRACRNMLNMSAVTNIERRENLFTNLNKKKSQYFRVSFVLYHPYDVNILLQKNDATFLKNWSV